MTTSETFSERPPSNRLLLCSYYVTPWLYPLSMTVQMISVYMTVLVSTHRFVGVCFPFKAGNIYTTMRVKIIIVTTVLLAILYNVTRWVEVDCPANDGV
jgi:hypothetical protein